MSVLTYLTESEVTEQQFDELIDEQRVLDAYLDEI
jgi:hypothetical protein